MPKHPCVIFGGVIVAILAAIGITLVSVGVATTPTKEAPCAIVHINGRDCDPISDGDGVDHYLLTMQTNVTISKDSKD